MDSPIELVPSTTFAIGLPVNDLRNLLDRGGPTSEVIAIEPRPAQAQALLAAGDLSAWLAAGRLVILIGPQYAGATGVWRPSRVPDQDPPIVVHPSLQAEPLALERAQQLVQRLIGEARANAEARRLHAGRYLLQTLANAPRIVREGDASSIENAFTDIPAILVAAGPSLDQTLEDLKTARDRALVICCDTAARTLNAANIPPNVIVAVDPSETNAMHLAGLHSPRASWLVAEGSLYPTAFAAFEGRTFTFNVSDHHPWPWLASLGLSRGRLAAWGSVATSALDLTIKMGCSPIIFAGLDLAFTGGRPYCRGTVFEAQWATWASTGTRYEEIWDQLVNRWPEVMETDIAGRQVRTAPHLVAFRHWIAQRIDQAAEIGFVNASGAGILGHPRIVQASCVDALRGAPELSSAAVEQRFRALHSKRAGMTPRLFQAIHQMLTTGSTAEPPREFATWIEFSSGVVRQSDIKSALRSHEFQAFELGRRLMRVETPV